MSGKAKIGRQMAFLFLTEHSQNTEKSEHFIFVLGDHDQRQASETPHISFWAGQSELFDF